MSTRSLIARENKNGSIDYLYCHFDGYLSHNGLVLFLGYSSTEKLNKLFEAKVGFSSIDDNFEKVKFAPDIKMGTAKNLEEFEKVLKKRWDIEYVYLAKTVNESIKWYFKTQFRSDTWHEFPNVYDWLNKIGNKLIAKLIEQEKDTIQLTKD